MAKTVGMGAAPQTAHCGWCFDKNQIQRHRHFLSFTGVDSLEQHLKNEYAEDKTELVDSIIRWVRTVKK